MPDNLKYPRFHGDRKMRTGVVEENDAMGFPWRCVCCPEKKNVPATHVATIEYTKYVSSSINVCAYHVGQARRLHTFEKFVAAAGGMG